MDLSNTTWYNELNSTMKIGLVTNDQFTGTYQAYGDDGTPFPLANLVGQTHTNSNGDLVIGFVALWPDYTTATAWSGLFHSETGQLIALWLLTSPPPTDKEWLYTNAGQDVFYQSPPEAVSAKSKTLRRSHPYPRQ